MHRDDQPRPDLVEDLEQLLVAHRPHPVDRGEGDVDAPEVAELVLGQHMVQMRDMGDAEVLGFDDEDRVAVGEPASEIADIGRHVANPDVLHGDVVAGEPAAGVPAAQHVRDRRVGHVAEMGVVGVVHRRHVGNARRAHVVVVVGRDDDAFGRLHLEGRMADIGDAQMARLDRLRRQRDGDDARRAFGDRIAARRRAPGPAQRRGARRPGQPSADPQPHEALPNGRYWAPSGGRRQAVARARRLGETGARAGVR